MNRFLVLLLFVFMTPPSHANLSLLQDKFGFLCHLSRDKKHQKLNNQRITGHKNKTQKNTDWRISELRMGRKDRVFHLSFMGLKEKLVFRSKTFLDFAVLFDLKRKESPGFENWDGDHAFFHIFENGQIRLLVGKKIEMQERHCEDVGAAKTCFKTPDQKLTWSGQKLELKEKGGNSGGAVTRYGHFPNDGTYFWAENSKGKSLLLIDFGARFDLITGSVFALDCSYDKNDLE